LFNRTIFFHRSLHIRPHSAKVCPRRT